MKILAVLQNQWIYKPEDIKKLYEHHPDKIDEFTSRLLFSSGCKTAQILLSYFGDNCKDWIWINSNPNIGKQSNAWFKPEPEYVKQKLDKYKPDVVIAFGRTALRSLPWPESQIVKPKFGRWNFLHRWVLWGAHPCCRDFYDAIESMNFIKEQLVDIEKEYRIYSTIEGDWNERETIFK